nr:helix-turn-helix domain-containing protein [Cohnella zeiphila]
MERHSERNITIDELAEMAGLSRYYYMRLFKSSYGISAMDYLTELRMNKAKRLMEQSKPKLREIAGQVGYADEFYFIRKFKQQIGIPPATYIRNRKRRVAAYSFPNIGQLLALQIVPFAAPMDHGWTDLYRRKYRTDISTTLSHHYEFNLAALRDARPDCIIGVDAFLPPEEQQRVREIAPALFVPWRTDDWRGHLRRISEFLDMSEGAEAWLRRYDRLAARTREQVRRFVRQEKVLVVQRGEDGYHVYGRKTVAGVLYEDLGMTPAGRAAAIEFRETVAPEELARFEADRILLMLPGGGDPRGARERLASSEEWKRTAASLGGRVTPVEAWPWFDYSAYAQERFLLAAPAMFRAFSN